MAGDLMDYQAILYDPIYTAQGVDATLNFATGEVFSLVVLDKTVGIDIGDGEARAQTIVPAAVVRYAELTSNGIEPKRFTEDGTKITFNSLTWNIESYRLRPSPQGEFEGEVYLLLSEKQLEEQAMKPAIYDFEMVRGATDPFTVQLLFTEEDGTETPIPFDDVRLTITDLDGVLILRKTFVDGDFVLSDTSLSEVQWSPTADESRLLSVGPNQKYELEIRDGSSQSVYMLGTITGIGGLNDD